MSGDGPPASVPPASGATSEAEPAGPVFPADTVFGPPLPGGRGSTGRAPGATARKRGRRVPSWRGAFFTLAVLAIVAGVAWALLGDRMFVVRSITVTGTHLLAPATVIAAADVPLGTPLLRVDAGSVTRRVEAIQQVASATVTEDWPDHLVIAVTERVPVMAVRMAGGGYDLVDPTGVIVRYTRARPAALPLFLTSLSGSALRGAPSVTAAAGVLAELKPWLARQVAQLRATPVAAGPQQVTLDLRDGQTVRWGSTDGAAQKNRELAILLPGHARFIDVSAPGTVVAKLSGGRAFQGVRPRRGAGFR
jgi:cell division protein FtsQ